MNSPDATDITGNQTSRNLGPADNGGPTWTHALLTCSIVVNAGTASGAPAADQRGAANGSSRNHRVIFILEPSVEIPLPP